RPPRTWRRLLELGEQVELHAGQRVDRVGAGRTRKADADPRAGPGAAAQAKRVAVVAPVTHPDRADLVQRVGQPLRAVSVGSARSGAQGDQLSLDVGHGRARLRAPSARTGPTAPRRRAAR